MSAVKDTVGNSALSLSELPGVRVLAGSADVEVAPLPPFSEEACAFLDDLSRTLMKDARAKAFPDVVSFAFWCRKANVRHERDAREGRLDGRVGRGLALHIAPGNVPVNFAFSYAFSLLAGNATVVRCPSRAFAQAEIILAALRACFADHPAIARRSALVTYPSSGQTTSRLSERADVRVIWGGDATVAAIRALPAKPRCVDIAFADRYSIALLDARAVCGLDADGLAKLARGFYNDTYLMDQNACSSPQTVLWVGEGDMLGRAHGAFWDAVEAEARARYELQAAVAVDKRVQLAGDVARGAVRSFEERGGFVTCAWLADGQGLSADLRGVGGYFYEKAVSGLSDVAGSLDEKYQTIVQFGCDPQDLRCAVIEQGALGVDRIVGVGDALSIGIIWDGFDLMDAMSRIVAVP